MPLALAQPVGRAVGAQAARFGQRARVALVGLHATAAGGIHRRVAGVRHDHHVAECLKVPGHPLALGARLEQHVGWRAVAEDGGELRARGRDPAFGHRAVGPEHAALRLALVQVEPYRVVRDGERHGWPPVWTCDIDREHHL